MKSKKTYCKWRHYVFNLRYNFDIKAIQYEICVFKIYQNEMLNIKPMLTISFLFDFVSLKQFRILAIKKLKIIENIINIKCFMSFMEQKNTLHAASHNFDNLKLLLFRKK